MRLASAIAAAFACAASPAFASSTILCSSTVSPTDGPELWLSLGNDAAGGIFQARFGLGREQFTAGENASSPRITQSWIDARRLSLQIADANGETAVIRLDTRRRGYDYVGILIHRGRTWRVRCSEEG
ncbi:MAG TPA: hypothetical protein VLK25_06295 [Allosphingosinicella sp.]|nr:hypothetical protein [Allosphingosinicella sp.]